MSAPTKGPYFLERDNGRLSIYPETWFGVANRDYKMGLIASVSPWDGEYQENRDGFIAQAQANAHLLAASWSMREALDELLSPNRSDCNGRKCGACSVCRGQAALAAARGEGR